ncbi:hypothetical protein MP228_003915 [Amoeboaphelidium protococcarum]|nr:hypothetical protein MP228_003915 [Amoeboaphelidium protococcarum]
MAHQMIKWMYILAMILVETALGFQRQEMQAQIIRLEKRQDSGSNSTPGPSAAVVAISVVCALIGVAVIATVCLAVRRRSAQRSAMIAQKSARNGQPLQAGGANSQNNLAPQVTAQLAYNPPQSAQNFGSFSAPISATRDKYDGKIQQSYQQQPLTMQMSKSRRDLPPDTAMRLQNSPQQYGEKGSSPLNVQGGMSLETVPPTHATPQTVERLRSVSNLPRPDIPDQSKFNSISKGNSQNQRDAGEQSGARSQYEDYLAKLKIQHNQLVREGTVKRSSRQVQSQKQLPLLASDDVPTLIDIQNAPGELMRPRNKSQPNLIQAEDGNFIPLNAPPMPQHFGSMRGRVNSDRPAIAPANMIQPQSQQQQQIPQYQNYAVQTPNIPPQQLQSIKTAMRVQQPVLHVLVEDPSRADNAGQGDAPQSVIRKFVQKQTIGGNPGDMLQAQQPYPAVVINAPQQLQQSQQYQAHMNAAAHSRVVTSLAMNRNGAGALITPEALYRSFESRLRPTGLTNVSVNFTQLPVSIENTTTSETSNSFTLNNTVIVNQRELAIPGFLQYTENDDFTIEGEIAKGGAARICTAKILSSDLQNRAEGMESCVVKILNSDISERDEIASFTQEISMMWFFRSSRNFAKLLGFTDNPPMIIMKKYTRGALSAILYNPESAKYVNWTSDLKFSLMKDIATGIKEMHDSGFAHCDIKSANILIDEDEKSLYAVLSDFGISRIVNTNVPIVDAFQMSKVDGVSVAYAAPEVLRRVANPQDSSVRDSESSYAEQIKATDVYSFAMVAYELVTRRLPWPRSMTAKQILKAVIGGERPALTEEVLLLKQTDAKIRGLCEIMVQCWVDEPQSRLQMKWVLEILEQVQNSSQVRG